METNKSKQDVYAIVTQRIIDQLKQGVIPWKKPWQEGGMPQNLLTRKPYRGVNLMLLSSLSYAQNYFLTFKQVQTLGARVKQGERSHMVVFWKWLKNNENEELSENEQPHSTKRSILRYYSVFNVTQCEGIPEIKIPKIERNAYPIETCAQIIKEMPNPPKIQHKEQKAYYNPLKDFVNMPKMDSFNSSEGYYSTLFHETVHSTGHTSRLNRKGLLEMTPFGSKPYSFEELVAEIGACYLESHAGIAKEEEFKNNVSYIQNWLYVLENDKHFILSAASQAQRASDYILNIKNIEISELERQPSFGYNAIPKQ